MKPHEFTAAQEILLAAVDLTDAGKAAFSEWDLTVAAWKRNRNRFGCREYEDYYPDHKRVMMEIMGQTKRDNPIRRQFITKVRPNYYELTSLGRAEAERLTRLGSPEEASRSPGAVFTAVSPYANDRSFRAWLQDPEEPRTWLGASAFFGLQRYDANHLNDRVRAALTAVTGALAWCNQNQRDVLTRGTHKDLIGAITKDELQKLREFIDVLQKRFEPQIAAIRKKAG